MMMVRIGETAKKAFATLDLVEHLQVVDALAKLSYFPNVAGVETLTGEHTGLFLLAVARFFIVFSVDGGVVTVERIMSEHL